MTPLSKPSLDHWHGLPSPQTPSANKFGPDLGSLGLSNRLLYKVNSTASTRSTSEIRETQPFASSNDILLEDMSCKGPPYSNSHEDAVQLPLTTPSDEIKNSGASQLERFTQGETELSHFTAICDTEPSHSIETPSSSMPLRRSTRIKKTDKIEGE